MMEVLPAPVGPVIANRSSFEKSMETRSRKLVKPSISRLIGRIGFLFVKCGKQRGDVAGRFGFVAAPVESREERYWIRSRRAAGFGAFRTRDIDVDMQRIRQNLADTIGDSRSRFIEQDRDTEKIVTEVVRLGLEFFDGSGNAAQRAA